MRIVEAIEQADELYPNNYSQEEKLRWCYELTVMLYEKFKKCYRALEFEGGEGFVLPSYIMGEDIEGVFVNGVPVDKVDDRSFEDICLSQGHVKVVYKVRPEPYNVQKYDGNYKIIGNKITIPGSWFATGDLLKITRGENIYHLYVMEVQGDTYSFNTASIGEDGDEVPLEIEEILTAETPMLPPYDSMYIDYILGKVAFYQNDMEEYNKQMTSFNSKLNDYALWYKQTNPVEDGLRFRNKW